MAGYNAPYRHYDVGTREEFDFYLKKWRGTTFNDFPILYLSHSTALPVSCMLERDATSRCHSTTLPSGSKAAVGDA